MEEDSKKRYENTNTWETPLGLVFTVSPIDVLKLHFRTQKASLFDCDNYQCEDWGRLPCSALPGYQKCRKYCKPENTGRFRMGLKTRYSSQEQWPKGV
jgi:hypothetical protein